jgi:hypothetical protein
VRLFEHGRRAISTQTRADRRWPEPLDAQDDREAFDRVFVKVTSSTLSGRRSHRIAIMEPREILGKRRAHDVARGFGSIDGGYRIDCE